MLLDPTLDVVFKLLLTRNPRLLHDMVESVLARPIGGLRIINPTILGEQVSDRGVIFDIHAVVDDDGDRVDLEMQRTAGHRSTLCSRMLYYVARNYTDQLSRGDKFHLLKPVKGIFWNVEPVLPEKQQLHSVFDVRDRDSNVRLTDDMELHLLQLPYLTRTDGVGYSGRVERWARFFTARDDDTRSQLASDPIMKAAIQTLEQLSQDPETRRLARARADALRFHEMDRVATQAQAREEGRAEGMVVLLVQQLERRFGALPSAARVRLETATSAQLEAFAPRVLTAQTLDEVFRFSRA